MINNLAALREELKRDEAPDDKAPDDKAIEDALYCEPVGTNVRDDGSSPD
jgi:hypothetical protein